MTWIGYKDNEDGHYICSTSPTTLEISMTLSVHPDPGPSSLHFHPASLDTASEFFQVLSAPYHLPQETPPLRRTQPPTDHASRCRATINWSSTTPTESTSEPLASSPDSLDEPIYQPHGRWAWTQGLPIDDPKQLLSLRSGCSFNLARDTILMYSQRAPNALPPLTLALSPTKRSSTSAESKCFNCRDFTDAQTLPRWKMSKQREWYGFYSEVSSLAFRPESPPTTAPDSSPCTSRINTCGHFKGMLFHTSSASMLCRKL